MISLLYLLIGLSLVSGQAPGDYTPKCREGNNAAEHIFPAEWRILMDTFDYENLFDPFIRNPAWTTLDADGDGNTWSSAVGGVCSGAPYVCVLTAPQNNWIFSQFIRYTAANEVFFNIKYDFSSCVLNPSCTNDFMTLYRYDQNSMTNNNDRTDIMNYNTPMFGTIASSRLEASGSASTLTKNESLVPTNNFNGFYMGIKDVGTCGQISRIIIYYLVCPAKVTGLVIYNEIAVPLRAASNVVYSAMCAANAHNVTHLEVTIISANSTCIDMASGGARCECNRGYFLFNTSHCEACSAGTYRSLTDTSCQTCPANTERGVVAAAECACLSGFYRNDSPQEGPEIGCTAPPSACEDLQVTLVTDTTVTLTWNKPITIGRSDLFYRVLRSNPNNIGEFVVVNNNLVDSRASVSYVVSNGLIAFTSYIFRVTTHNGVSDQDPDGHLRIREITTTTMEGLPGQPGNVQRLCTVVVWQAPSQPNGIITRYDINFQPGTTRMLSAQTSFYLTTTEERHPDTTVKVRAVSGVGPGPWSSGEPVGCTDGASCPVLPTNPPPTCPTSTPDTNVPSNVENCTGYHEGISCSISGIIQSVVDIIETKTAFILDLSCSSSSISIGIRFTEISGSVITKQQVEKTLTVMVDSALNRSLISIDKSKLDSLLVKGRFYSIQVMGASSNMATSFTFRFTETKFSASTTCTQLDCRLDIIIPIGICLLVLITVAIIVCCLYMKFKKTKSSLYEKNKTTNNAVRGEHSGVIELDVKYPLH